MSLMRLYFSVLKCRNFTTLVKTQQLISGSAHQNRGLYLNAVRLSSNEPEKNLKLKQKLEPVDRTKVIPVETSIKYLSSDSYRTTYGDKLVWEEYRRNHKGAIPPKKTRKTCIRQGVLATGNPCPICRDEYLVLDHRNLDLLKQFISPHSGEVISYSKTGLCQKKHLELLIAVERAMDCGSITFDVPYREFDYSEYYDNGNSKK